MEKENRAKRRKRTLLKQEKRLVLMRALGMQGGMLYEKHRKKAQRSGGYMRDGNVSHFVSTKPRKRTRDRSRIGPVFLPPHRDLKRLIGFERQTTGEGEQPNE